LRHGDGGHVQHGAYTLETVTPQGERVYTRIDSIQTGVPYDADLSEAG
jgi:D-arabinitol 4-dehydrogenase